jgi:hypothetical protein
MRLFHIGAMGLPGLSKVHDAALVSLLGERISLLAAGVSMVRKRQLRNRGADLRWVEGLLEDGGKTRGLVILYFVGQGKGRYGDRFEVLNLSEVFEQFAAIPVPQGNVTYCQIELLMFRQIDRRLIAIGGENEVAQGAEEFRECVQRVDVIFNKKNLDLPQRG